jgi:hypothetical protein
MTLMTNHPQKTHTQLSWPRPESDRFAAGEGIARKEADESGARKEKSADRSRDRSGRAECSRGAVVVRVSAQASLQTQTA